MSLVDEVKAKGWVQDGSGAWSHPSRGRNNGGGGQVSGPIAQQIVRNAPVEPLQGKTLYAGRVSIRVHSFRRRSIDPDNGCIKWMVDSLRYLGVIPNDRPEDVEVSFSQTKVSTEAEEHTRIVITPL